MHSDELSTAVTGIVDLLNRAGIRTAIDQYRFSKGDQRPAAAARLGHAGAALVEKIDEMSANELKVVKCLHLDSLGSTEYWQNLLADDADPKAQQAEIVRLASRVMFASSHLPAMTALLSNAQPSTVVPLPISVQANPLLKAVEDGEGALFLRLTDAGERASDPDRIARAIDGVDMLYSACASIARKPAIDLRLDTIVAKRNHDRDFRFTGDKDSISALFAVIDSIPGALAEINPDQDIDLDVVVRSLPIFNDLTTLSSIGTFSGTDLKDISETMHQGALLTLESGVILIDEASLNQGVSQSIAPGSDAVNAAQLGASHGEAQPSAAESDEYYNRYLREREAMMRSQGASDGDAINGQAGTDGSIALARAQNGADDKSREEAVDELLKSLQQRPS